jgi:hypothetical protein
MKDGSPEDRMARLDRWLRFAEQRHIECRVRQGSVLTTGGRLAKVGETVSIPYGVAVVLHDRGIVTMPGRPSPKAADRTERHSTSGPVRLEGGS